MKILIYNQPVWNRGDEAAHKSLIRSLNKRFPNIELDILFWGVDEDTINQMEVKSALNHYSNIKIGRGFDLVSKILSILNLSSVASIFPYFRKIKRHIKEADIVICAPGGINLGAFMSWRHVYSLLLAVSENKKLVYYSRSFGPFNMNGSLQKIFFERSKFILESLYFLSVRDNKTLKIAEGMGLRCVPSIDTAFLDMPTSRDCEMDKYGKYVVFVPNSLTWHPYYKNRDQSKIDSFYIKILEVLSSDFDSIIMLPQLFNDPVKSDYNYFISLTEKVPIDIKKNIIVLEDTYSSDFQQTIISGAAKVVGARYHSIVFAINNNTPFVALSYEHKIEGLLDRLSLKDRMIDITSIGTEDFIAGEKIDSFSNLLQVDTLPEKQNDAQRIAANCFDKLAKQISRYNI